MAIQRCSSTSSLRRVRSPDCRYSRKRSSTASLSRFTSVRALPHGEPGVTAIEREGVLIAGGVEGECQFDLAIADLEQGGAQLVHGDAEVIDGVHIEPGRRAEATRHQAG